MIFCLFISAHYAYIYIYIFGLTLGSYNVTVIVAHGISIITSAAHLSFPFLSFFLLKVIIVSCLIRYLLVDSRYLTNYFGTFL